MRFSRRTKRLTWGFFILLAAVAFALTASWRVAESVRDKRRAQTERAELRPPEPVVVTVAPREIERQRRFAAELRPWMRAEVPAEVSGRVTEVLVEAGDAVAAGQPLVRLDDTLARIAVEQATARLEESRRLFTEAERLLKTRTISETVYKAQASSVRVDQAMLADALERLKRHTVRAPFAGLVDERMVDLGEAVNANQPVARVVDLEKLRVEFFVSAADWAGLQDGTRVPLFLESHPQAKLHPEVRFVSPAADPTTRLFRIEAVLENTDKLPGGLTGLVTIPSRPFAGHPFIPSAAVEFSGRESYVWRIGPQGSQRVPVRVGPEMEGYYPVLEGLSAGDRVEIR